MTTDDRIDALFSRLDTWRHLPSYQLERRADVIFSLYLKGVLEEAMHVRLREEIIPEFPLQKQVIWPENDTQQSDKVDFVLFAEDLSKVYLVELKTDAGSRRISQDEYLKGARRVGFRRFVQGIIEMAPASKSRHKYHHLLAALAKLGFVRLPDDLDAYLRPEPRHGLSARLRSITATDLEPTIEIVYVQPLAAEGENGIDFETFAAHVERFDDPLSQRFARSLREWRTEAGKTGPPPSRRGKGSSRIVLDLKKADASPSVSEGDRGVGSRRRSATPNRRTFRSGPDIRRKARGIHFLGSAIRSGGSGPPSPRLRRAFRSSARRYRHTNGCHENTSGTIRIGSRDHISTQTDATKIQAGLSG